MQITEVLVTIVDPWGAAGLNDKVQDTMDMLATMQDAAGSKHLY